jgi:RNA polymerase sigma-70 factor (ECF subfamily)
LTPQEFASLYQSHHRALWCIAAAIVGDRTAAYDVVQEAAMTALTKLNEFDAAGPATSFVAWAGQIVRFVALNHRRSRIRSKQVSTDPAVMAASARGAAAALPDMGFSAQLSDALGELDDVARACLLMRTVMDMSHKEIAAALGIPEGTAMSHVHRSRHALRRKLEEADAGGRRRGEDE